MRAASTFWITGLPRSRTAWFSQAMRGPYSTCFHELTADCRSFEDFRQAWFSSDALYSGNADSACGLQITRILDEIRPRTLIVERPIGEVLASLADIGIAWEGLRSRLEQLEETLSLSDPLIKRVRFEDLNDRDAVIEAAEWLVPGHGVDAASLLGLNIQVTPKRIAALADLRHTLWHLERAA